MQYASYIAFALTLAGVSQAAPAPLANVRRQTPATCSVTSTGYLAVRPTYNTLTGPITWVGTVGGVKHAGIDGQQDSILVTVDDNGNPLAPQKWEFATCTSANGHAPPPGYQPSTNGPTNEAFGILRPSGASQHCLALESSADTATGARNSVLDSYCTQVPEEYRLWMKVDYINGDSDDGQPLYFANENMTVLISNTAHKELQFITNDSQPSSQPMQLTLLPNAS
jgi:hypothetical protein